MANPISNLGTIPTFTVGSETRGFYTFVDIANLISLGSAANTNPYGTFRQPNSSSGYAVTVGKTLKLYAASALELTNVAGKILILGYGDTDVGINSAAGPTNPINMVGSALYGVIILTAYAQIGTSMRFDVPATKYPFMYVSAGNTAANIFGYEV